MNQQLIEEILLQHRTEAIAISEGRSNGLDIGTSAANAIAKLNKYISERERALIDRIEASVKQHTVPEGWDLATKSYIFNTLEFERSRAGITVDGEKK